jgi:hypothetical protein
MITMASIAAGALRTARKRAHQHPDFVDLYDIGVPPVLLRRTLSRRWYVIAEHYGGLGSGQAGIG